MSASILVVDDQLSSLENLEAQLQDVGYKVYTAIDGEEALRKTRFYKPDVIILDIYMPGMRGDAVADALKVDPLTQNIPIIFLTTALTKKDVAHYVKIEERYFIAKPYQFDELLSLLARILPQDKGIL